MFWSSLAQLFLALEDGGQGPGSLASSCHAIAWHPNSNTITSGISLAEIEYNIHKYVLITI